HVLIHHLFFFQAEDGIRDRNVTGVQTCALPSPYYSSSAVVAASHPAASPPGAARTGPAGRTDPVAVPDTPGPTAGRTDPVVAPEIGRASCRERVGTAVVGGSWRGNGCSGVGTG